MNNILDEICLKKKEEIEISKKKCSYSSLEKILKDTSNRGFAKLLIDSQKDKKNNIIAEIKKASPSAGVIKSEYFPEIIAAEYEKSGVGAISILTESNFFQGNIDHMSLINKLTKLPIIRKDFIIDPYQVIESKIYKADAILLIASILKDEEIKNYLRLAKEYGLDCLIEIHSEIELKRVLKIEHPIIGINNRNLKNLSVNIENTIHLLKKIPKDFTIIAESGIKSKVEIKKYNEANVFNFLIGESILKSTNIQKKIKDFLK